MDLWRTEAMIRLAKIALTAGFGLFAALVTWSNVVDPGTNFAFVEHVLQMDTTFRSPALMGRAIEGPLLHRVAFGLIVAVEATVAGLCLWGALQLGRARRLDAESFHTAKAPGAAGFLLGLALWFVGFQVIGGEWFASWQSEQWNGLDAASRISSFLLGSLIFLTLRND